MRRLTTLALTAAFLLTLLAPAALANHRTFNIDEETGNHICQVNESVKIRVFAKATPGTENNLNTFRTEVQYAVPGGIDYKAKVTFPQDFVGDGAWHLVHSVTIPQGKIGTWAWTAWDGHAHEGGGTRWILHQKRCV